jgi:hypothetical protein
MRISLHLLKRATDQDSVFISGTNQLQSGKKSRRQNSVEKRLLSPLWPSKRRRSCFSGIGYAVRQWDPAVMPDVPPSPARAQEQSKGKYQKIHPCCDVKLVIHDWKSNPAPFITNCNAPEVGCQIPLYHVKQRSTSLLQPNATPASPDVPCHKHVLTMLLHYHTPSLSSHIR